MSEEPKQHWWRSSPMSTRGRAWWVTFAVFCGSVSVLISVVSSYQGRNDAADTVHRLLAIVEDNRLETNCRAQSAADLDVAQAEIDLAQTDFDLALNDLIEQLTVRGNDVKEIAVINARLKAATVAETTAQQNVSVTLEARRISVRECLESPLPDE
jgi:hypothetical protein